MNKIVQRVIKCKLIIIAATTLSGCPLTVNLNVSTDKPIALVIDKPIELKLGADIAVTKLPPVKVGIAHSNTPSTAKKK
ncbi:MAG: hypothetical protein PHY16_19705 [Methylobacter sp.]|nr:hypothetical protein [Methylobacter sp.]